MNELVKIVYIHRYIYVWFLRLCPLVIRVLNFLPLAILGYPRNLNSITSNVTITDMWQPVGLTENV